MSQPDIIFAYMIPPGSSLNAATLLPESLRCFGRAVAANRSGLSCLSWSRLTASSSTRPSWLQAHIA